MRFLNEHDQITQGVGHFGVLDFGAPGGPDYMFRPWCPGGFTASGAVLRIGPVVVELPAHWHILCEQEGITSAIAISDVAGRGYEAFGFNPLSGYRPQHLEIRYEGIGPEKVWTMPELREKEMVLVPILASANGRGPTCIMLSDRNARIPESSDSSALW